MLKSYSEMSTGIRCLNCHNKIDRFTWKQCSTCKNFILCEKCAKYPIDLLQYQTRKKHIELHEEIGLNNLAIYKYTMQSISILRNLENVEVIKKLDSMIQEYHQHVYERNIRILSLDGGGIRSYMPFKIIQELITEKYLPDIKQFNSDQLEHKKRFEHVQSNFTNQFDYFVGTGTSALIAFCLAINYNILNIKDLYSKSSYYFKRNCFASFLSANYNPSRIHDRIDEIINTIILKNGKHLSAEHATLLDIHNFLNPDQMISDDILQSISTSHDDLLEFVDEKTIMMINKQKELNHTKKEKVFLICLYNATRDINMILNTSYSEYWSYRIADVLKASISELKNYPPYKISKGVIENGRFISNKPSSNLFYSGETFANDPSLHAIKETHRRCKDLINYRILSIGTGYYNSNIFTPMWKKYFIKKELLLNTHINVQNSSAKFQMDYLPSLNDIKRMRFNYKLAKAKNLNDLKFVNKFNEDWKILKNEEDFKVLIYFYNNYIIKEHY